MCGSPVASHKVLGKRLNSSQGKNPQKKKGITTTIAKCNSCGLIYSNPQPIPHDLQDHYGVPPENYWKEEYFLPDENNFLYEILQLRKLRQFPKEKKSLDIGAGLGKGMIALAREGFDAYGIEPSRPFYERAIEKMKIDKAKLKLATVETADYPENYFDFITFKAVLEHLYDPSAAILKAMKWLKPGGLIHIGVPSSNWLTNRIVNRYYKLRGTDYVANISPMHTPYHLYEFSVDSFRKHAAKNNYELEFSEHFICETYMPKSLDFILKPYMKWTKSGMEIAVWLKKK